MWYYQDTKAPGSLDTSEMFSYQQLEVARSINRRSAIAAAFNNFQGIAWERGDLKKALVYLDSSFKYTDLDKNDIAGTNYYDKADIYIELKDYVNAARMADQPFAYVLWGVRDGGVSRILGLCYSPSG